jgi:hydrogenase nickel incorporation protein HypB
MCGVCGCGEGEVTLDGHTHTHTFAVGGRPCAKPGLEDTVLYRQRPVPEAFPVDASRKRLVQLEQDILSKNNSYAEINRDYLARHRIFALNLVSSPGSGKTTLLVETISRLRGKAPLTVIEGDQQTSCDADRIRTAGARAIQINTGKGCHLDADMVGRAIHQLQPEADSLLLIENVGNLVCPAGFDLGEAHKVVILSVTEGEDKPLKYPDMFYAATLMVLNKVDLLPYLDFDIERCIEYARRINPRIQVLRLSARTGEGMEQWIDWLERRGNAMQQAEQRAGSGY